MYVWEENYGVGEDSWESLGLQGDQTQLILKESSLEYSLEGLMLKLKLQSFGHLMQRTDSLEKTLMAGGEGDDRAWDGWMASLTWRTWVWASSGSWWWTGRPGMLLAVRGVTKSKMWTTELNWWEENARG